MHLTASVAPQHSSVNRIISNNKAVNVAPKLHTRDTRQPEPERWGEVVREREREAVLKLYFENGISSIYLFNNLLLLLILSALRFVYFHKRRGENTNWKKKKVAREIHTNSLLEISCLFHLIEIAS